jgi:hypothetical protein
MAPKSSKFVVDGIAYELSPDGARRVGVKTKPKIGVKRPRHTQTSNPEIIPLNTESPNTNSWLWILTSVRMVLSIRFWLVVFLPIGLLIVIKTLQLNSYELVQTGSNWLTLAKIARLQLTAVFFAALLVVGVFLEAWLRKLAADNKPTYWSMMAAIVASSLGYGVLIMMAAALVFGVCLMTINQLYVALPILTVFICLLIVASWLMFALWCWSRRNLVLSRFGQSLKVDRQILLPKSANAGFLATTGYSAIRILPTTMTLLLLLLVIVIITLVFVSGLSVGWQALTMILGLVLSLLMLSYDHLAKLQYWRQVLKPADQYKRYPSGALTMLGVDALVVVLVAVALMVQLVIPKLLLKAHLTTKDIKKTFDQLNLTLPSPKQVKPFDNSTQNR